MYKLVNGVEMVSLVKNLVNKSENKGPAGALRGNNIRVHRESFPAQIRNDFAAAVSARHVFFSNRVVPHWNKLQENVVKSNSMESAATAPHGQLAVMGSDNLHVRCRSKNYYYYYYY
ncbi:hypothetical protein BpHYR1_037987 [Brachionus plicatilis]|uniref:RNA-directed DNA polymerase from mobile element jockey-like n=1 Tax=Brachionus plicatilis TaxID=10195 RepID=A0A3M7SDA4_BRAPC|nr:hypothetical protein BpHYR1_037987 [Brachionus plicatilis]